MNDSTCRWPECERQTALKRGLCPRDYKRAGVVGDFEQPWEAWAVRKEVRRANMPLCRWPGCTREVRVKGLCFRDSRRAATLNNFVDPWTTWDAAKVCERCGSEFRSATLRARYCSERCEDKAYVDRNESAVKAYRRQHLASNPDVYRASAQRRRAQKRATAVERFTTKDVRMAHGDICYLCGDKINFRLKHPNPKSPSLDHVIALSRGGTHTIGNVAMTHLKCNLSKQSSLAGVEPHATLFAI